MANPEAVAALCDKGLIGWSDWKHANPGIVDLRNAQLNGIRKGGADLSDVDLTSASLQGAHLLGAHFRNTSLVNAALVGANLGNCDLQGANLSGANLTDADLSRSNLQDADLTGATLIWTLFRGGNLFGTNFTGALLLGTVFAEADLSKSKGLGQCVHHGPSTIGADTLFASKGEIPRDFLRSAGVQDVLIEHIKALVGAMAPIQFYSCFISYSTKDQEFANRLYADLQANRVRCWLASEDLKIGDPFRQRIDESIRLHDKSLLILSEQSVQSAWVQDEVEAALEREHRENRLVLFPIRIDEAVMEAEQAWAASIRRARHIGDFSDWKDNDTYQKALQRLLRDLKAEGAAAQ